MTKYVAALFLAIQAFAVNVYAGSVAELAIASDMAAFDITSWEEPRGKLWNIGVTRNDDVDATTASIAFNAIGQLAAANNIRAGVGWKASYHNTFQSSYSLAVGGSFRYEPQNLPGIGFEGLAYLAPDVLTTNDTEQYRELMARVTYALHANATVFAGWTNKTLDYKSMAPAGKLEIADGLMAGFSLAF